MQRSYVVNHVQSYVITLRWMSVSVLNGRNVIPLDPNGLSDPFVLIELCPRHLFPNQSVQQTLIIKKTLNPTFDESFEL